MAKNLQSTTARGLMTVQSRQSSAPEERSSATDRMVNSGTRISEPIQKVCSHSAVGRTTCGSTAKRRMTKRNSREQTTRNVPPAAGNPGAEEILRHSQKNKATTRSMESYFALSTAAKKIDSSGDGRKPAAPLRGAAGTLF